MRVTQDPNLGSVLQDKYRVISEIGRGGMSVVYKARHEMMDKEVAIKMLQQGLMNDQNSIKRFQQEAQAASCLAHQNVITIFDFGVSPTGQPYLVMDFLEGHSLADVIKAENHIGQRRAAAMFIQACDALEHAHQKGVLHRDLKSSNIMLVDYDGNPDFVKVVDFGIAKLMPNSGKQQQNLTATGEIFGSPIYMSPEQCLGLTLDARSDIYSMGTMLYEALTGQPPLLGANIIDTMQMHVESVPPKPSKIRSDLKISGPLEMICVRALEKKPENRFKSMGEFRDALLAIVPLMPVEPGYTPGKGRTGTRQNMPGVNRQGATGTQSPNSGVNQTPAGNWDYPGAKTNAPGAGIQRGTTGGAAINTGRQNPTPGQNPNQDARPDRFAPPAHALGAPGMAPNPNYPGGLPAQPGQPQNFQTPTPQQQIPQPQYPQQQNPQQQNTPGGFKQEQSTQGGQVQPPVQSQQGPFVTGSYQSNPQEHPGQPFQQGQNPNYNPQPQAFRPDQPNDQSQQGLNYAQRPPQPNQPQGQGGWPVPTEPGQSAQTNAQSVPGQQQGFPPVATGQYPQQQSPTGSYPQSSLNMTPGQSGTGSYATNPQQATGSQSQYVQQSATGTQPSHLMAASRPEIVNIEPTISIPGQEHPADDSLFGNPSLYGERSADEAIQFQTQYERNKAANKPAPSHAVRHTAEHLPSKRINSDYSDLLDAGDKKAKKGASQAPQRQIYAPELPKDKTSLIIMIVLGTVAVIFVMGGLCWALYSAVKPH